MKLADRPSTHKPGQKQLKKKNERFTEVIDELKTGENNEDLLFCYEVLTQSPTG